MARSPNRETILPDLSARSVPPLSEDLLERVHATADRFDIAILLRTELDIPGAYSLPLCSILPPAHIMPPKMSVCAVA